MWPFTNPTTISPVRPDVQRAASSNAHERLGVAISLIQNSNITAMTKPSSILELAQRLRNELGVLESSNVERSPIYLQANLNARRDIADHLRMIRALLEGTAKRAQEPILQQPGVTSEKQEVIDDIHQNLIGVLRSVRIIEDSLRKSERQAA